MSIELFYYSGCSALEIYFQGNSSLRKWLSPSHTLNAPLHTWWAHRRSRGFVRGWKVYYCILCSCWNFCLAVFCTSFSCLLRLCLEPLAGGLPAGGICCGPPGKVPSSTDRRPCLSRTSWGSHTLVLLGMVFPLVPHLCLSGLGSSDSAATC